MFKRERIDKSLILKEDYCPARPGFHLLKILAAVLILFLAIGVLATARAEVNGKACPAYGQVWLFGETIE